VSPFGRLRAFWHELERRNVLRWTLAYLAAAWILLQVAAFLSDTFTWPVLVTRVLTVLAAAGAFATLILAWYHGDRGRQRPVRSEVALLGLLAVAAGTGIAAIDRSTDGGATDPRTPTPPTGLRTDHASVAVLPFVNLSPDEENAYFAHGIHEDVLSQLAKIRDLMVISRTSVLRYADTDRSIPEIARELGVGTVLEGSVRREGDRVRVVVQLIDAGTDAHIWSETYDRELTVRNVFDIQSDLARRISATLKTELTPDEERRIASAPTGNTRAYELYLRGRHAWRLRDEEGIRTAIDLFGRAVEEDPSFAGAYGALAGAHATLVSYGIGDVTDALVRARDHARHALSLDEDLAEAHASLAFVEQSAWRWEEAETPFRRALALNPNSASARHWYALYLACLGRTARAVEEMREAHRLDPLSVAVNNALGLVLYYHRDFPAALDLLRRAVELEPDWGLPYSIAALAHAELGNREDALEAASRSLELTPEGDSAGRLTLAYAHARLGGSTAARRILVSLDAEALQGPDALFYGLVEARLGRTDRAFAWLERARADRTWQLGFLKVGPRFDPLREDPRFDALVARLGLDPAVGDHSRLPGPRPGPHGGTPSDSWRRPADPGEAAGAGGASPRRGAPSAGPTASGVTSSAVR